MSDIKIGVIGGSGIYKLEGIDFVKDHKIETPFGSPSGMVKELKVGDDHFYFIPRHGEGHFITPSEINYRANIFALKSLGVSTVISISAVGSLKEELSPTMFVLPDQFIDWTKGKRERTFFEKGMVGHVSVANPVELGLQKILGNLCKEVGINYSMGGSYVCIEGPQFSTKAESAIYRNFGCSVIGMTNVPESYLAKEAGMAYATVAAVTDYDCWKQEHCTLEEIMKVMEKNYQSAQKLITATITHLSKNPFQFIPENKYSVVTKKELLSAEHQEILKVLLKE